MNYRRLGFGATIVLALGGALWMLSRQDHQVKSLALPSRIESPVKNFTETSPLHLEPAIVAWPDEPEDVFLEPPVEPQPSLESQDALKNDKAVRLATDLSASFPEVVSRQITRPYLGISKARDQDLPHFLSRHLGIQGLALAVNVLPEGPAQASGLLATDLILGVDGRMFTKDFFHPTAWIKGRLPGERLLLNILRGGRTHSLSLQIGARHEAPDLPYLGILSGGGSTTFEALWANLSLKSAFPVGQINDPSPALEAGLKVYDLVLAIDEFPVNHRNYRQVLNHYKPGDTVAVHVIRDGSRLMIPVTLGERKVTTLKSTALGTNLKGGPQLYLEE